MNTGTNNDLNAIFKDESSPGTHFCISTPFPFAFPSVNKFTLEDENVSMAACKANPGGRDTYLWVKPQEVDLPVNSRVDFTGQ